MMNPAHTLQSVNWKRLGNTMLRSTINATACVLLFSSRMERTGAETLLQVSARLSSASTRKTSR